MKIGFIGLGNMAKAIIGGLLKDEIVAPSDIIGASKTSETEARIRDQYGIQIAGSNAQVAEQADVLVLAIKPIFVKDVIDEIRGSVRKDTLIVSIVAGKTIAFLEEAFGNPDVHIVRTMPNTPAMVGEGCTGVCVNANVTDSETELALKLMRSFGKAYLVPERLIDVVGAVSGSSPAFVFMFIEAMADGAVAGGMPRAQAYKFAAQAVLGSAKLVLETGMHPGELKDMVCSPGGTTIEGVKTLEEKGLRGAVMDAMEATLNKTKKL